MKLFITTPAAGGVVHIQYVTSLIGALTDLSAAGIECEVSLIHGGPFIAHERNLAVNRFLESDGTHLLFIDADIEFDPKAVLKMLLRDKSVIGGLYPYKSEIEGYPARILNRADGTPQVAGDGTVLVDGLPTGLMLIKREVFHLMIRAFPELAYRDKDKTLYALFEYVFKDGVRWGEDYTFCNRWRSIGGDLYAEPNIKFSHYGTKGWKGNWHEFMLRQPGGSEYGGY